MSRIPHFNCIPCLCKCFMGYIRIILAYGIILIYLTHQKISLRLKNFQEPMNMSMYVYVCMNINNI